MAGRGSCGRGCRPLLRPAGRRRSSDGYRMAIDILSIPAMSDEPERVFSGARRTISWDRAQLSAENIEKLECLKCWMRSGISEEIHEIEI